MAGIKKTEWPRRTDKNRTLKNEKYSSSHLISPLTDYYKNCLSRARSWNNNAPRSTKDTWLSILLFVLLIISDCFNSFLWIWSLLIMLMKTEKQILHVNCIILNHRRMKRTPWKDKPSRSTNQKNILQSI